MEPRTYTRLTLFILLLYTAAPFGFTQTPYNYKLISTEKELNFAFTEKRGIKTDDGLVYYVDQTGKALTAFDKDQNVTWTAEILKVCPEPVVGSPEIRYIKLTDDHVYVVFGKHSHARVDTIDGKIKCLGSD